jgi:acetoin utilization protein AcuB
MDMTMTAAELMTGRPARLKATSTVEQALALLQELDLRHLPVVDQDEQVIGMVSDRDFQQPYRLTARISDVMSSDVAMVRTEASVDEILDLLLERKIGAIPVTNADDTLVGIVSYIDILRQLRRDLSESQGRNGAAPHPVI